MERFGFKSDVLCRLHKRRLACSVIVRILAPSSVENKICMQCYISDETLHTENTTLNISGLTFTPSVKTLTYCLNWHRPMSRVE